MNGAGTAASRFTFLDSRRQGVLRRARRAAALTIPSILPPEGHTEDQDLTEPYQALGARAVNTLASKLILALYPPNLPFFRLSLDDDSADEVGEEASGEVQDALSKIERKIVKKNEASNLRKVIPQFGIQLIVTGNGLVQITDKLKYKLYRLDSYCVVRDGEGEVIEIVIKESVDPRTIPANVREVTKVEIEKHPEKDVDVYTWIQLKEDGENYQYFQEINETRVPDSEGTYPKDKPRFIAQRWKEIPGESYGRGMVEEYIGDFSALDVLSRDLQKASHNSAKIVWLRRPGSMVDAAKFQSARSGDILEGKDEDIVAKTMDKFGDFKVTHMKIQDIETALKEAFLMHQSVQRNAERVTAEEIRFMAQELEDALGGIYSTLAQDFQRPQLQRVIALLQKSDDIPQLPKEHVDLLITTGLDALSRGHEVNKFRGYAQALVELFGPDAVAERMSFEEASNRLAAGFGIDTKDLVKSDDQVEQEQLLQQIRDIVAQAAPGVAQETVKQGATASNG